MNTTPDDMGSEVARDLARQSKFYADNPREDAQPEEECTHENVEWDPGNHVPPFGWEQYPGWFCEDCREEVDDPNNDDDIPDPVWDFE